MTEVEGAPDAAALPERIRASVFRAVRWAALAAGLAAGVALTVFGPTHRSTPVRLADASWAAAAATFVFGAIMVVPWLRAQLAVRRLLGTDRWRARRVRRAVLGHPSGSALPLDEVGDAAVFARAIRFEVLARALSLGVVLVAAALLGLGETFATPFYDRDRSVEVLVVAVMVVLMAVDAVSRLGRAGDYAAAHPLPASPAASA